MDIEKLTEMRELTGDTMSERREELKKEIIKTNLSSISDEFTKENIRNVCEDEADLKFDGGIIEQTLIDMEGVYVRHISGNRYKKLEDPKSPSFEDIATPVWKEYKEFLNRYKKDGLTNFMKRK